MVVSAAPGDTVGLVPEVIERLIKALLQYVKLQERGLAIEEGVKLYKDKLRWRLKILNLASIYSPQ